MQVTPLSSYGSQPMYGSTGRPSNDEIDKLIKNHPPAEPHILTRAEQHEPKYVLLYEKIYRNCSLTKLYKDYADQFKEEDPSYITQGERGIKRAILVLLGRARNEVYDYFWRQGGVEKDSSSPKPVPLVDGPKTHGATPETSPEPSVKGIKINQLTLVGA